MTLSIYHAGERIATHRLLPPNVRNVIVNGKSANLLFLD